MKAYLVKMIAKYDNEKEACLDLQKLEHSQITNVFLQRHTLVSVMLILRWFRESK